MLELLYDNVGWEVAATATSEAAGYDVEHLFDGSRHTFWQATSTATQEITFDAGAGNSKSADYVALARADLLVEAGATVVVRHSDDGSSWTDAFTSLALASGHLVGPRSKDWVTFFPGQDKRFWQLRITGTSSSPMFAGLWLGARHVLARGASGQVQLGWPRATRGAELALQLLWLEEEAAEELLAYVATVTPGWPGEQPTETAEGVVYGSAPHWIFEDDGRHFRRKAAAEAQLLNVQLMSPGLVGIAELSPERVHLGELRYREVA